MKKYILLLLCALTLAGCGGPSGARPEETAEAAAREETAQPAEPETDAAGPAEPEEPEPDPRETAVETALSGMTLAEKVGQLFFIRCPESGAAEDVSAYHPGGVLLFTRDFQSGGDWLTAEAVREKLASYQAASGVPLLIGVDEEGGSVARASRDPYLFDEKCRSPQALYAAGGLEAVRADAEEKSRTLLDCGINVNLAPVADVSTEAGDFIYDRAFGQDAPATAAYVAEVVEAMGRAGIGSVLKHFPGYGSNADTHTGAAVDERPYEQFLEEDFLPFRAGIGAGAGAVLVSHNTVTCMDPERPASLSPAVHEILRREFGFTGVAMTDDLAMDAAAAAGDSSAAVLAVLAGNDMLISTNYREEIAQTLSAAEDGTIPAETVDSAVRRVLGWKYDLGLLGVTA